MLYQRVRIGVFYSSLYGRLASQTSRILLFTPPPLSFSISACLDTLFWFPLWVCILLVVYIADINYTLSMHASHSMERTPFSNYRHWIYDDQICNLIRLESFETFHLSVYFCFILTLFSDPAASTHVCRLDAHLVHCAVLRRVPYYGQNVRAFASLTFTQLLGWHDHFFFRHIHSIMEWGLEMNHLPSFFLASLPSPLILHVNSQYLSRLLVRQIVRGWRYRCFVWSGNWHKRISYFKPVRPKKSDPRQTAKNIHRRTVVMWSRYFNYHGWNTFATLLCLRCVRDDMVHCGYRMLGTNLKNRYPINKTNAQNPKPNIHDHDDALTLEFNRMGTNGLDNDARHMTHVLCCCYENILNE